jgi:hypothetical protein
VLVRVRHAPAVLAAAAGRAQRAAPGAQPRRRARDGDVRGVRPALLRLGIPLRDLRRGPPHRLPPRRRQTPQRRHGHGNGRSGRVVGARGIYRWGRSICSHQRARVERLMIDPVLIT